MQEANVVMVERIHTQKQDSHRQASEKCRAGQQFKDNENRNALHSSFHKLKHTYSMHCRGILAISPIRTQLAWLLKTIISLYPVGREEKLVFSPA